MPHRGKRNAEQAFLAAVACGTTIENTVAKAGIGISTAYRWLQDPAFHKRLTVLKKQLKINQTVPREK